MDQSSRQYQIRGARKYLGRLVLLAVMLWAADHASAQFSPGPLSKAHHALNGPGDCTACHAVAAGVRQFKCLGCHTEIRERLAARRGLHAEFMKNTRNQQECIRCHSEHNGERFVPIRWDVSLDEFDHSKTGYVLEGAHRRLECARCHRPEYVASSDKQKIKVRDLHRTYLGLGRECRSCHRDEHRGEVASDCAQCHSLSAWKPATGFDHAKARFPLGGAHQRVACAKCHPRTTDAQPHTKFAGMLFAGCAPCHSDPHHGAFPQPCQACHSESVWKPATLTAKFDHSHTHFPLLGKHDEVLCSKCHKTSNFKEPVAHAKCLDCHQDIHRGQFLARADRGECGNCHTADGWKPSTFSLASHRATLYPLEGRHAAVVCARCHTPIGAATIYKVRFERCADCHEDGHRGQFAGMAGHGACESCHTVGGFRPSTFSLARHRDARFLLTGGHTAVPCGDCHYEPTTHKALPGRYRLEDRSCSACHRDPHRGEFRESMRHVRGDGSAVGCEACHVTRAWRDLSKFDHATTAFPLVGTHRGVTCRQCHPPPASAAPVSNVSFRAASRPCSSCHEDVHAGQFSSRAGGSECSGCHNLIKWKPSLFNHDKDSDFALTGAHRGVRCAQCHTTSRVIQQRNVVVFRLAPKECSACHGPKLTD